MALVLDGNGDITGLAAGALPSNVIGAGAVLQVVQGSYTTQESTSSTSFAATSIAASITPSSSSSKIYIVVNLNGVNGSGAGTSFYTIYRNSTNLGTGTNSCFAVTVGNAGDSSVGMNFLDSPSTTSSTTYTVYLKASSGTTAYSTVQGVSIITLIEVAG